MSNKKNNLKVKKLSLVKSLQDDNQAKAKKKSIYFSLYNWNRLLEEKENPGYKYENLLLKKDI